MANRPVFCAVEGAPFVKTEYVDYPNIPVDFFTTGHTSMHCMLMKQLLKKTLKSKNKFLEIVYSTF